MNEKPVVMSVESSRPVLMVAPTVAKSSAQTLMVGSNQQINVTQQTVPYQSNFVIMQNANATNGTTSTAVGYKRVSVKYGDSVRHFFLPVSTTSSVSRPATEGTTVNTATTDLKQSSRPNTPQTSFMNCSPKVSQPLAVSSMASANVISALPVVKSTTSDINTAKGHSGVYSLLKPSSSCTATTNVTTSVVGQKAITAASQDPLSKSAGVTLSCVLSSGGKSGSDKQDPNQSPAIAKRISLLLTSPPPSKSSSASPSAASNIASQIPHFLNQGNHLVPGVAVRQTPRTPAPGPEVRTSFGSSTQTKTNIQMITVCSAPSSWTHTVSSSNAGNNGCPVITKSKVHHSNAGPLITFKDSQGNTVCGFKNSNDILPTPQAGHLQVQTKPGTDNRATEGARTPKFIIRKSANGVLTIQANTAKNIPSTGVHLMRKPGVQVSQELKQHPVIGTPKHQPSENEELSSLKIDSVFSLAPSELSKYTAVKKADQQVCVGKGAKIAQSTLQVQTRKDTNVKTAKSLVSCSQAQEDKNVTNDNPEHQGNTTNEAGQPDSSILKSLLGTCVDTPEPDFTDVEKFFDVMDITNDIANQYSPPHVTQYSDVKKKATDHRELPHTTETSSDSQTSLAKERNDGMYSQLTVSKTISDGVCKSKAAGAAVIKTIIRPKPKEQKNVVDSRVAGPTTVRPTMLINQQQKKVTESKSFCQERPGKENFHGIVESKLLVQLEPTYTAPSEKSVTTGITPSEPDNAEYESGEEPKGPSMEVETPGYLDVIEIDPCKVVIRDISKHFPNQNVSSKKEKKKTLAKVDLHPVNIRKRPWSKFVREHLSSYYREEKFARLELDQNKAYKVLSESPLTVVAIPGPKAVKLTKTVDDDIQEERSNITKFEGPQTARKRGHGRVNSTRMERRCPQTEQVGNKPVAVVSSSPKVVRNVLDTTVVSSSSALTNPCKSVMMKNTTWLGPRELTNKAFVGQNIRRIVNPTTPKDDNKLFGTNPKVPNLVHLSRTSAANSCEGAAALPREEPRSNSSASLPQDSMVPKKEVMESVTKGLNLGSCVTAGFTGNLGLPGKVNDGPENYLILKTSTNCYYVPVGKNAYVVPLNKGTTNVTQTQTKPLMSVSGAAAVKNEGNVLGSRSGSEGFTRTFERTQQEVAKTSKAGMSKEVKTHANTKKEKIRQKRKRKKGRKTENKTLVVKNRNQIPKLKRKKIKSERVTESRTEDLEPPKLSPAPSPILGRPIKTEPAGSDTESCPEDDYDQFVNEGVEDEPAPHLELEEPDRVPFQSVADLYREKPEYRVPVSAPVHKEDAFDRIQRLRNLMKSREKSLEKTRSSRSENETKKLIEDFDNI